MKTKQGNPGIMWAIGFAVGYAIGWVERRLRGRA
jgi:hypothetical protein